MALLYCSAMVFYNETLFHWYTLQRIFGQALQHTHTHHSENCVKVIGGVDTCTVAFLSKVIAHTRHVLQQVNKFAQVVELYKDSQIHTNEADPIKTRARQLVLSWMIITEEIRRTLITIKTRKYKHKHRINKLEIFTHTQ